MRVTVRERVEWIDPRDVGAAEARIAPPWLQEKAGHLAGLRGIDFDLETFEHQVVGFAVDHLRILPPIHRL
ncbi:MAG: hypothetical protein ACLFRT_09520 [Actinomycetota bacterium]